MSKSLTFDIWHHEVQEAVHLARIKQGQQVRVLKVGGDADLGEEAVHTEHGAELGPEYLERHAARVLHVTREKHGRHSAGANLALDLVPALEGRCELVQWVHEALVTCWLRSDRLAR